MIAPLSSNYFSTVPKHEDIKALYAKAQSIDFSCAAPEKISADVFESAKKADNENQNKLNAYLLSRNPQAHNENGIYWMQTEPGQAITDITPPIHTTNKGTSISVQTVYEDVFFKKGESVYCDLTNQHGLHVQFQISQNTKIIEGEDGDITIIQPDSRQKIVIDSSGHSSFEYLDADTSGALIGTDGDDILINVDKPQVDAGAGNDTILNFANGTVLNAGEGNDTIHLLNDVSHATINTDAGRNSIYGKDISNSQINLNGEDFLEFYSLSQSDIRHSGSQAHIRGDWAENVSMKYAGIADVEIGTIKSSSISSESQARVRGDAAENVTMAFSGKAEVSMGAIHSSSLTTEAESSINASIIENASIEAHQELTLSAQSLDTSSVHATTIKIYAATISHSEIYNSRGSTNVTTNIFTDSYLESTGNTQGAFSMIYSSTINTGSYHDKIRSHHIQSSNIYTGDGDDLVEGIGISNTTIDTGKGNDNIVGTDYTGSTLTTGEGNDNIFFWNLVAVNHDLNLEADKAYKTNYQYLDAIKYKFVDPEDLLQNAHVQDLTQKLAPHKEHISLFI